MKKIMLSACIALVAFGANAQKYFTKDGKVYFSATSSIEKIEATNTKGTLVIDASNGKIESAVLVKGFHFEKALMEEHFNENYIESHKFPKATFVGTIADFNTVNLKKDGDYPVTVKGKFTMHGVTKDMDTKATLTVKGGAVTAAKASFKAVLADYGIAIPGAVKDKIAKEAKIDINTSLQPLK